MDLNPIEREAVRLRWEMQTGEKSGPPESEIPRLIAEIYQRREAAEADAISMLSSATRTRPSGGGLSGRFVVYIVAFLVFLALVMSVVTLFRH